MKEERNYANTDGSVIDAGPSCAAGSTLHGHRRRRPTSPTSQAAERRCSPMGRGCEYVLDADLVGNAAQVGRGGGARSSPRSRSTSGATTSCCTRRTSGSPSTSRSRTPRSSTARMGYEANYAGTSFIAPPEKMLGKLKYGPRVHEHPGRPLAGGRARHHRLGRRRREARRVPDRQGRHLQRLPDHARAGAVARLVVRAAGAAGALARLLATRRAGPTCSSSACPTCRCCPARRISSWDDLIAATDRGIAIIGDGVVLHRPAALQRAVRRRSCSTRSRAARSSACSRTSPTRSARPTSGTPWT